VTFILQRTPTKNGTTIGHLQLVYGDDRIPLCWTLEDAIREVEGQPVSTWKVLGETAIPAGVYQVVVTPSKRFHRKLPLLLNVPGFTGIRIHAGNTKKDTEGCIIPGLGQSADYVFDSRAAMELLLHQINEALLAGERVEIDVRNPLFI